jgi:hypothetical protein
MDNWSGDELYLACLASDSNGSTSSECPKSFVPAFPNRAFNTWQVDLLQLLVESNDGVTLFPYWVNASDYNKDTDETLQSTELHEAVKSIVLADPNVWDKLSSDLNLIAKGMGVQLLFLPVLAKEEMILFVDLILKATGGFDADAMALLWCAYVDGVTIFPKLPVYIREYHGIYLKNGRVIDAVKAMKSDMALLDAPTKERVPLI